MGIPLKSLLGKRDPPGFLPSNVASFYTWLYDSKKPIVYHYESEIIWHAVGESTWAQLDAYLIAMSKHTNRCRRHLWYDSSLNLFSAKVRKEWAEWLGTISRYESDVYLVLESTDFSKAPLATGGGGPHAFLSFDVAVTHRTEMHLMRRDFIKLFNAKHSDLDPPLRSSDALAVRLLPFGGLRTFQPDWTDFIERRDRRIQPGYLTPEELQHLEKKGIRFGASDASVGFQHVMDTRTPSAPDPSDLLGLPSLIGQSISGTFVWPEERVVFPKRPLKQVTLEPDEDDEQWWVRAIGVRRLRDF